MNAVNTLSRDMSEATRATAQAKADAWTDEAEPVIRAYLAFGDMLDELAGKFNGWKPEGDAERFMAEVHSALCKTHGEMRRSIEDYRAEAIGRAHPLHNRWGRFMSEAAEDEAMDLADALAADTVKADAAIKAVERSL